MKIVEELADSVRNVFGCDDKRSLLIHPFCFARVSEDLVDVHNIKLINQSQY